MEKIFNTVGKVFRGIEADMVVFVDRDGVELDMMDIEDKMKVLAIHDIGSGIVEVTVDAAASDFAA